jgi:hypothetical protein
MTEESAHDANATIGQRIQERFDFYLIALTFAVLGFATQTAHFGRSSVADAAELSSWLILLISGVVGLSRLEWLPQLFYTFAQKAWHEDLEKEFKRLSTRGVAEIGVFGENRRVSTSELIEMHSSAVKKLEDKSSPMATRALRKYKVQKYSLAAGFAALLLARGLPRALSLCGYVLC